MVYVSTFSVLIKYVASASMVFVCFANNICDKRDAKNGWMFTKQQWLTKQCNIWVYTGFVFVWCEMI